MNTATLTPAPLVKMARHKATNWPARDRAELSRKLAELGITITEASDARQLGGRARLSDSTPEQRHYSHHWFRGTEGKRWLAKARELRALFIEAIATLDRGLVAEVRHRLGIRRSTPATLRLNELQAVYSEARAIEISREPQPEPPAPPRGEDLSKIPAEALHPTIEAARAEVRAAKRSRRPARRAAAEARLAALEGEWRWRCEQVRANRAPESPYSDAELFGGSADD